MASLGILCVLFSGGVMAQDVDPRRYVNLPVAQNILRFAISHSSGDVNVMPTAPLEDAQLSINATPLT